MRRRLKQVLLPIILIALALVLLGGAVFYSAMAIYRRASNQELAVILGAVEKANPQADMAEVIRNIRSGATSEQGEDTLRSFGYMEADYVSPSAEHFAGRVILEFLGIVALCALLTGAYFWWLDWQRERRVKRLVVDLQDLNNQIYDLQLESNQEDELSLLSNELYKITVTLKAVAEQNYQAKQNLETALADISHQLRTPLTSLQVMIDNIYDDAEMPAEVRQDFLRSASRQVTNMSELVMTLLNLAKLDNGSIKMQNQPVTAQTLLHHVSQNLEVLADLHDVRLEISGDLAAKAELDLRWQVEALTNIVKNCIEHSSSGSKVLLHAEDNPLFLRIVIGDFGEGIAAKDLRHIFERFYRASNTAPGSVGIGLAFAKAIIEANNGQISVKSTVGKGTTFTVTYFK